MLWHPFAGEERSIIGLRAEQAGAQLTIGPAVGDGYITEATWALSLSSTSMSVRPATELSCTVVAYTSQGDDGLSAFLTSASEDLQGWSGERRWRALENVEVVATSRGSGRVRLAITLCKTADPDSVQVTQPVEIEAGESLQRLADLVSKHFGP